MVFRSIFQQHFLLNRSKRLLSVGIDEEILTENISGKLIVTLNRPKTLNALNISMVRKLYPMLKKCNSDSSVPFIFVKGAGSKAFCAGGDIVAASRSAQANDPSNTVHKDFFREEYVMNHLIGVLKVPYIAVMDGITMGGGCGLSVHGKYRIATERTMLTMPETSVGFFPDVGGTFFLSRLPYNLGQFMALTGYRLIGADAYHMGLATHFVPSEKLKNLEDELLRTDNKLLSAEKIDHILNKYHMKESEIPKFGLEKRLAQINYLFSGSTVESIFKKLRNNNDDFGKKLFNILSTKSPTSLKVTFRQLQIGLKMQFPEVFTMEYRLSQRFMKSHDFHEGCRAILINKDQKPIWKPASIEEITDEMMDEYFAPLHEDEELIIKEFET
ncbi:enoyl-CoA hydratase/isomerase [Wuchereria bancrofti]|uniref:3-hydroxyisobutyryl-CoA hydrolase, mitochondrial n=1 Tax=Wuchereria bancrofti TaxID=6293 RepID=J9EX88_WUCBA|nr:enoyl-CoA hydratase/isomerase [Wuchereria bancrofti]